MRNKLLYLISMILILVIAAACSPIEPAPSQGDSSSQGSNGSATGTGDQGSTGDSAPQYGGTLMIGIYDEPATMDPHVSTSPSSLWGPLRHIFEKLVDWDEELNIKGDLAESWTISPDGKVYTFKLRDAVFHNGDPLTSEDVKWSIERILEVSPRKGDYSMIDSIETPDPKTVVFHLKEVSPPFLGALSMSFAYIHSKRAGEEQIAQHGNIVKPVGTGPYEFVEWISGQHTKLKRFEGYIGVDSPPDGLVGQKVAYLDELIYQPIVDDNVRMLALQSGQIHFMDRVHPKDIEVLQATPGIELDVSPGTDWGFLTFNFTKPPFDDIRMRQAIAYGIDWNGLAEAVFWGYGVANHSFLPDIQKSWRTPVHDRMHEYNPELAAQLVEEAGYKGAEIVWPTINNDRAERTALFIERELTNIGLNVKIETMEQATFLDLLYARRTGDMPDWTVMATTGSAFRIDPDQHYYQRLHSSTHPGLYENPELDAVLDEARTITDEDRRRELYERAQEIMMDDIPGIVLFNAPSVYAWSDKLHLTMRPREPLNAVFWNAWFKE